MEPNCNSLTERILQLTLEIIYLLTGEDSIVVKRTSEDGQNPIMVPLHSLLRSDRKNDKRILKVINKMTELLTGQVPVKCQNVSINEWKYKDIVMEDHQTLTSPGKRRLYFKGYKMW
ncbi:gastrula zinc finger protein XlCGF66.1-like [Pyxicephalus adspersus]|uniref:gastrula zinc finger protein XlCGF66.1-like n=1 Tax=Pyxicephalus adspersus TaxID=30357 RepID=UPI003B5AA372